MEGYAKIVHVKNESIHFIIHSTDNYPEPSLFLVMKGDLWFSHREPTGQRHLGSNKDIHPNQSFITGLSQAQTDKQDLLDKSGKLTLRLKQTIKYDIYE